MSSSHTENHANPFAKMLEALHPQFPASFSKNTPPQPNIWQPLFGSITPYSPFQPNGFGTYKSSEWQMVRDSAVQSDLVVSSMFAPAQGPQWWLSWESRPAGWHWGGSLRCSWSFFVGDLVTGPENSDVSIKNDFWLKNPFLSPLLLLPLCALPLPLQLAVPAQPAPVEKSHQIRIPWQNHQSDYTTKISKSAMNTFFCTSEFRVSIYIPSYTLLGFFPQSQLVGRIVSINRAGRAFSASSILRSSSCRRLSWSILTVFL